MPSLDLRTIFACHAMASVVCIAAITRQWLFYRRRFDGLGLWLAGAALPLPGLILIALRGAIPDLLSMTVGNTVILGGLFLLLLGLRSFYGFKGGRLTCLIILAVFAMAHAWFAIGRPSLRAREVLFGAALVVICWQSLLVLARIPRGSRSTASGMIAVLVAVCLASLARLAFDLAGPEDRDFLAGSPVDSAFMILGAGLSIALVFAMVSMIGRRVVFDQERLIAEKSRAESDLAASEEKFSKAFNASPDVIMISRLSDGRFIEVNEGFSRILGYSRDEALGDPPIAVVASDEMSLDLLAEIERHSFVRDREVLLRDKSGDLVHARYSGGLIDLRGEKHVVSVVRDLSEHDRAESILRVRLDLREYAVGHTAEELMVKALDEIEEMTGSRIGFYHLVDEERGELSLGTWSTRTKRDFCRAEGSGSHYPIEAAGVWADAVRERRPIVHNDYSSARGKKGMPEGHADVVRELVAPTFRDGRIIAILGVGNKPSDYLADDVALVSYVADLIWTIVEQKRSDERILQLNSRLEALAMTDELTGIANRRAFFAVAEREMSQSIRYGSPISFLMLDIDHFKLVNDTHGHDAGDAVLKAAVGIVKGQVRDVDLVARLGGEEFGVLMPHTRAADALVSAQRIRAAVAAAAFDFRGLALKVTVSIGVAARSELVESLDELMKAADEALYRAKAAGRDRVEG